MLVGALLLTLAAQDTGYARAESLLAAHDLPAARRAAEQFVMAYPRDARAHLILGRVWLAWPVIGRYTALSEFRIATKLAPGDPQPLYGQVRVGQYLGSDEGEWIVREAILKIFMLTPNYEDCWALFEQIYHNDNIWRRADQALARHPDDVLALERRAQIAIALGEPARADSLAALVLARRAPHVPAYLRRAEAAFNAGRDSAGLAWYDSALVYADLDSTGALWDHVWMIASKVEADRLEAITPEGRRGFFEGFWGHRDPNLLTPQNERIAEHSRRLVEVRRMFKLLHPFVRFHRSPYARALAASYVRDSQLALLKEGGSPFDSLSPAGLFLSDLRDYNDTVGHLSVYGRANLSARGLVWLRHGRPDYWDQAGSFFAVHEWTYYTPDGPLKVRFHGIPGAFGAHGDYIIAPPRTRREARQLNMLLTTDRSTLPAQLEARGWSAFFKSDQVGNTDLYVRTEPETAAVVLWDTGGAWEIARAAGAGLLAVTAPPGLYGLGLDVDSSGTLGRIRQAVRLPAYSWASLGLSSLILATADTLSDRETTLHGMPAALVYPSGHPLAAFAEIYGLSQDGWDRATYRVRYTFTPLRSIVARVFGGGSPVVFEFERQGAWQGTIPERLVIEPGRLPPGRYRVTLAVTDVPSNVKSETVAVEITIR